MPTQDTPQIPEAARRTAPYFDTIDDEADALDKTLAFLAVAAAALAHAHVADVDEVEQRRAWTGMAAVLAHANERLTVIMEAAEGAYEAGRVGAR